MGSWMGSWLLVLCALAVGGAAQHIWEVGSTSAAPMQKEPKAPRSLEQEKEANEFEAQVLRHEARDQRRAHARPSRPIPRMSPVEQEARKVDPNAKNEAANGDVPL